MGFRIQILSLIGSLGLLYFVFDLMRRRWLREEYALLWLVIAIGFLIISVWRGSLDRIAQLVGIYYAPAALFLVMCLGAYLLLMHFSLVISRLSRRNQELAQEVGLLQMEIVRIKRAISLSENPAGEAAE